MERHPVLTLHTTEPGEIRRQVVQRVLGRADAEIGLFYSLGTLDGEPRVSSWCAAGNPAGERGIRMVAGDARLLPPKILESTRAPAAVEARSFVELDLVTTTDAIRDTEYYRRVASRFGFLGQIRLLVFHGRRFVGWIGAFRPEAGPRFRRKDRRRLAPLVEPVSSALIAADGLARGDVSDNAYLLARPDGTIDHASCGARAWLEKRELLDAVRDAVRAADAGRAPASAFALHGAEARVSRLDATGSLAYLLQLRPLRAIERAIPLGRRQQEVAELVAAGATVAEAARHIGISAETVRSHLRVVYRRLGARSRVELLRALESNPREDR